jgi:hypothetical protein
VIAALLEKIRYRVLDCGYDLGGPGFTSVGTEIGHGCPQMQSPTFCHPQLRNLVHMLQISPLRTQLN